MPWIDPFKEARAWELLARAGFASEVEIIRSRGGNPRDVLQQIASWRKQAQAAGVAFSSNAATAKPVAPPANSSESAATEST